MSRNLGPGRKYVELESKLNDMEKRVREKFVIQSKFAEVEVCGRKFSQYMRRFDRRGDGRLNFQEFFTALSEINFIGVQREIAGLFNRYDETGSGYIDHAEFSLGLFGLGMRPSLDDRSKKIIEVITLKLVERAGACGLHSLLESLYRLDVTGSRTIDRRDLEDGLRDYGTMRMPSVDMQTLFNYFADGDGQVGIPEFVKVFVRGMSTDRKTLVTSVFRTMDKKQQGFVPIRSLMSIFDATGHPSVAEGLISPSQAAKHFLIHFAEDAESGVAHWTEFLEYYKGLSIAIDDDAEFESVVRSMWYGAQQD